MGEDGLLRFTIILKKSFLNLQLTSSPRYQGLDYTSSMFGSIRHCRGPLNENFDPDPTKNFHCFFFWQNRRHVYKYFLHNLQIATPCITEVEEDVVTSRETGTVAAVVVLAVMSGR